MARDDGLLHLTKDGGTTWQNVTPAGLPECLINAIEVSPHDPATVYIATTRYKFNDHTPALYKSTDYGKTWANISKGIPQGAFTRVVREDEVRKDLLFAGTETGVYISWDGGRNWSPFQLNLPVTPITDLRVHQGNLIAATSGRSFWILDDLSLLRQYRPGISGLHLFEPAPAMLGNWRSELDRSNPNFTGTHPTRGVNPASGLAFYYHLPELSAADHLTLEIRDAQGQLIRTYSAQPDSAFQSYDGGPPAEAVLPKSKGLNRFVWDLRYPIMPGVPIVYIEGSYRGHKASPGKYSATLKAGDRSVSAAAEILPNPLYPTDAKAYQEYHELMNGMEAELTRMHRLVNTLDAKRGQLEALLAKLEGDERHATLRQEGQALAQRLRAWDEDMVQRKSKAYDDVENFPNKFTAEYLFLINHVESDIPRPNQASYDRQRELNAEWAQLEARARALLDQDIPAFNERAWQAGLGAVWR